LTIKSGSSRHEPLPLLTHTSAISVPIIVNPVFYQKVIIKQNHSDFRWGQNFRKIEDLKGESVAFWLRLSGEKQKFF
jgi:hypothetical protein